MKRTLFSLTFIVLASLFLSPLSPAMAQDISAEDVIAAVNNLRSSNNLAVYLVDSGLMNYAQQHSKYQASINTWTHQRSDGTFPGSKGLVENVAVGNVGYLNVSDLISAIWADALHMKTMVGYTSGYIGVGVASNSTSTYVTLDLRPGDAAPAMSSVQSVSAFLVSQPARPPLSYRS